MLLMLKIAAVRQNSTDLIVEALSRTGWLPVCANDIPDELASRLCRELGQRQVICIMSVNSACRKHIVNSC